MLPITLRSTRIALAGAGEALRRRQSFLAACGIEPELVSPGTSAKGLSPFAVLFVAGLPDPQSSRLAGAARRAGVLVNVEDQPDLCDFFVPAVVRRGDLLISISTSGKSPGLAKLVRQWIERILPPIWAERLKEASAHRAEWRLQGASPAEVAQRTSQLVDQHGWLP
jgi:precorrin-2 dehydrogenase/sirohydrochlorin ferrochelatase